MNKLFNYIGKTPKTYISVVAGLLVVFIGIIDYLTGYEISVSIFYLLPIALVAWFEGGLPAIVISILSAVTWFLADAFAGHVYPHLLIEIWNTLMRLVFFLIIVFSLVTIKNLLAREKELSRTDSPTEIPNRRAFYERAQIEIERTIKFKRPLSIAYIDVDNFKEVNDTLGHSFSDSLLYSVAQTIRKNISSIDIVSRFGEDEFAILMSETDEAGANEAIERVNKHLMEIVKLKNWSVTFTIGAFTWYSPPSNLDELIKESDNLMHSAKRNGNDMVKYNILRKIKYR